MNLQPQPPKLPKTLQVRSRAPARPLAGPPALTAAECTLRGGLRKRVQERDSQRRLIVILQKATLETTKVGKSGAYELLNCDDHQNILRKHNRDIADCRPDITHQVRRARRRRRRRRRGVRGRTNV